MRKPLNQIPKGEQIEMLVGFRGEVMTLYTDAIDLRKLGRVNVRRWTTVEFSQEKQLWQVRMAGKKKILHSNKSREECLQWERTHFTRWLKSQPRIKAKGKKKS